MQSSRSAPLASANASSIAPAGQHLAEQHHVGLDGAARIAAQRATPVVVEQVRDLLQRIRRRSSARTSWSRSCRAPRSRGCEPARRCSRSMFCVITAVEQSLRLELGEHLVGAGWAACPRASRSAGGSRSRSASGRDGRRRCARPPSDPPSPRCRCRAIGSRGCRSAPRCRRRSARRCGASRGSAPRAVQPRQRCPEQPWWKRRSSSRITSL